MRKIELMGWLGFALLSAIFLGIYDIFKKLSVNNNAVLPVLLVGTVASSIIFLPIWILSISHSISTSNLFYIPPINYSEHILILIKTLIVLTSWIFTYFALKHLSLTTTSPIRASGPVWTLFGAIIIYNEQLTPIQWLGLIITLLFFFSFSARGSNIKGENTSKKWIWFLILGTLAAAASGLYDKYLMRSIHRMAIQCYFSFYQVGIMLPIVALLWWPNRRKNTQFVWRWSIPMIGITLVVADFLYFYALSYPDSLISLVSSMRRGSVIISFMGGAIILKEGHIKQKALYLIGILAGMILMLVG